MRLFFSPSDVIMKHQPKEKLSKGMTGRNTLWIPGKMQKVLMQNDGISCFLHLRKHASPCIVRKNYFLYLEV